MKHNYPLKNSQFHLIIGLFLTIFSPFLGNSRSIENQSFSVAEVPVIEDQSFTIVEGSVSGTTVGMVNASAEGNMTNYEITNASFLKALNLPKGDSDQDMEYDARNVFSINSETGALAVNDPKYLLYVLGPIALEVEVTDTTGEKASATITVTVTDMEVTITENIKLNWTTAANHPQGHAEATGGAVNGNLYVFGGFTSVFGPKASVFGFDPSENRWSRLRDMPPMADNSGSGGATHMGFTDDGTDIYIAAGYAADASGKGQQFGSRRVYKYMIAQDRYEELPSLPLDRSAGALEYIDNKLYYVAGTNKPRDEDQSDLLVLDLDDLSAGWSYLPPLPNPRNHVGSAVFDGKLYVFGGQKEHDEELVPQDDVHRYDPATNMWTQLADMPRPFNHIHASIFVYGDRIYSIGGQIVHNATPYASVYAYDPATNTWAQFTDLPAKRFSIVGGGIDGKLYASGGNNARTTYVADLPEAFLSTENAQNMPENDLNRVKIYPNPAKNSLFISKIGSAIEITSFSIYNLDGRLLQNFAAEKVKNNSGYHLPVGPLSAGIYILNIKDQTGSTVNKRFLVQ